MAFSDDSISCNFWHTILLCSSRAVQLVDPSLTAQFANLDACGLWRWVRNISRTILLHISLIYTFTFIRPSLPAWDFLIRISWATGALLWPQRKFLVSLFSLFSKSLVNSVIWGKTLCYSKLSWINSLELFTAYIKRFWLGLAHCLSLTQFNYTYLPCKMIACQHNSRVPGPSKITASKWWNGRDNLRDGKESFASYWRSNESCG